MGAPEAVSAATSSMARRWAEIRRTGKHEHAYCGALAWCVERGLMPKGTKADGPVTALPGGLFGPVEGFTRREVYAAYQE